MLAFSNDYYGMIFRATQSVELFCAYDITGWNQFLPLDLSDQLWAEAIQKEDIAYNRLDGYDIMCKAGFDIVKNMNTIETIIKSRL